MIRGVNKKLVEVNNTENKYFERVLLVVRPEFAKLKNSKLDFEAKKLVENICKFGEYNKGYLRKKKDKKRIFAVASIIATILFSLSVLVYVILLII